MPKGPLPPSPNYVAVDVIAVHDGKYVLITRKNKPYGLALPGGFVEPNLTLFQNAVKELKEEAGLDAIPQLAEAYCIMDAPDRDPRGRVISVAYRIFATGTPRAGDDALVVYEFTKEELIEILNTERFAFKDHKNLLTKWLLERD